MDEPPIGGRGIVGRIYANLGLLIGGKAAAGLLSLAYMIIAARALGPGDYGVLVLVHGFVMTVGGIIEFPGWHAVVRYGAHAGDGDGGRLVRLLRFTAMVEGAGGLLAVATAAVLAPIVGPKLGWSPTALAFALPYSLAVLGSIRSTPAGYLQLVGRFDLLGMHNAVAPIVRLAGALLVWAVGGGLHGFLIAWLVAALAEWAAMWIMGIVVARSRLRGHGLVGLPRGVLAENQGILRFMVAANADVTFGDLAGRIAPLAVGWVLGPAAAGLYAVAQRATMVIAQPAQILGQAAYAELARLVAGGGHGHAVRHALERSILIGLIAAAPIVTVLILCGRPIAVLMGGPAFAGAAGLIAWLAVSRLILVVAPPCSAALVAFGRPALSVAANMGSSIVLLPLLPLLMLRMGLIGAGVQALVQAAIVALLLAGFVRRESVAGAVALRAVAAE